MGDVIFQFEQFAFCRRLLEVADGKDMPRLFVMEEDNNNRLNKALNHVDPFQRRFRLRICCEFSSAPHILEGHAGFELTSHRVRHRFCVVALCPVVCMNNSFRMLFIYIACLFVCFFALLFVHVSLAVHVLLLHGDLF